MPEEFYQISNLKVALKDLEPMVKGGDVRGRPWLIDGNNSKQKPVGISVTDGRMFKMRPREAWGNWLMCAVLSYVYGVDFSFQDSEADGIIFNRKTKDAYVMEHVCAMDFKNGPKLPTGEARILWAIDKKLEKCKEYPGYAKGKNLLVFVDGAGLVYPNRVGRAIPKNDFGAIYGIIFVEATQNGYSYGVTYFRKNGCPMYRIDINSDFTDWKVKQLQ